MDEIQLIAVLCREMSWTYEDYMSQPIGFIMHLLELLKTEAMRRNERL